MSRAKIAAGNWKMYNTLAEANQLVDVLLQAELNDNAQVILGVPFVYLQSLSEKIKGSSIKLSAQNCHEASKGAFTGEISAPMLASIGTTHVILGHSERRMYFDESDDLLLEKVKIALENGLTPIFCCGESLEVRKAGEHHSFVADQLRNSIFALDKADFDKLIIAYEPIWAIGTGETATPEQAQSMHENIREVIAAKYDQTTANNMSILYGGSVKANNAKELFSQPDVDGGLVGGASLNAAEFITIINSFQ